MANLTLQVKKALSGYGNVGDVITVTETAEVDYLITVGALVTYNGPITPTVVGLNISRVVVPINTGVTLPFVSGIDYTVLISAGGIPTLPTAVGNTSVYTFVNVSASAITPVTTSSQTINGAAPGALAARARQAVISDGSNWQIC